MGGFEINRDEYLDRFLILENRPDERDILDIFYQNFTICKIIFIAISLIRSSKELFSRYERYIAIFATDDILSIIGSEERILRIDTVEEVTSPEDDPLRHTKSPESERDDTHTSKCSWTTDTPYFFYTMKFDEGDNFIRKAHEVISFWYGNFFFIDISFEDEDYYICRDRIDEEYVSHR